MKTVLTPCRVPWAVSPSMSDVTLFPCESEVGAECSVVFDAGRRQGDGRTDVRQIEIAFERCYYSRTGPHSDSEDIEAIGHEVDPRFEGEIKDDLAWRRSEWRRTGSCPDSGFYVARESAWLKSLPKSFQVGFQHYVVDGRDGYVELIAQSFKWREWLWVEGDREDAVQSGTVVAAGEGIA